MHEKLFRGWWLRVIGRQVDPADIPTSALLIWVFRVCLTSSPPASSLQRPRHTLYGNKSTALHVVLHFSDESLHSTNKRSCQSWTPHCVLYVKTAFTTHFEASVFLHWQLLQLVFKKKHKSSYNQLNFFGYCNPHHTAATSHIFQQSDTNTNTSNNNTWQSSCYVN